MMPKEHVNLRTATSSDCEDLADIHSEAWLHAYRGVLNGIDLQRMIAKRGSPWWEAALQRGVDIKLLSIANRTAGYATFGPCRLSDIDHEGEIYELYLRPVYQGLGFGKLLFQHVQKTLAKKNRPRLAVQVLSDNVQARAFYEAVGGSFAASSWHNVGNKKLELTIYSWPKVPGFPKTAGA